MHAIAHPLEPERLAADLQKQTAHESALRPEVWQPINAVSGKPGEELLAQTTPPNETVSDSQIPAGPNCPAAEGLRVPAETSPFLRHCRAGLDANKLCLRILITNDTNLTRTSPLPSSVIIPTGRAHAFVSSCPLAHQERVPPIPTAASKRPLPNKKKQLRSSLSRGLASSICPDFDPPLGSLCFVLSAHPSS